MPWRAVLGCGRLDPGQSEPVRHPLIFVTDFRRVAGVVERGRLESD